MNETSQTVLEDLLSLEFYRFKRYKVPIALALIQTNNKDLFSTSEKNIRKTDLMQQIDTDLYAIIYTHTSSKGGQISLDHIFEELPGDTSDLTFVIEDADQNDSSERDLIERTYKKLKSAFRP